MEKIRNFFKDESGANMVEYALMLSLIALVCILALNTLGGTVKGKFEAANNALTPSN